MEMIYEVQKGILTRKSWVLSEFEWTASTWSLCSRLQGFGCSSGSEKAVKTPPVLMWFRASPGIGSMLCLNSFWQGYDSYLEVETEQSLDTNLSWPGTVFGCRKTS